MRKYFICGALVAVAYIAGRFQGPERVEYRDKEVIVYKENVDEQKARDKTTRKKEVRLPDGTVTIETIIEASTSSSKSSTIDARKEKETEKIEVNRRGAILNLMVGVSPFDLSKGFDAGVNANIPLVGPLYFGPWILFRPDLKGGVQFGFGI